MAQAASATDFTWNGSTTGTWDTTGTNWIGGPTEPWNSTNGLANKAILNLASLDATVSGTVYTNGITFSTTGALGGGTINLAGTAPTISVAASQTGSIGSAVSGAAGLAKADTGTLILSGANDYTGGTAIKSGTLQINTGGTLGSTSGALSMGTGTTAATGTVGNLTINTNTQVGAFTVVSNTSNTSGSNIGQLSITSGSTLTVSSLAMGLASSGTGAASPNTALSSGTANTGGTLAVSGDFTIGAQGASGLATQVLNLSGLTNFNAGSGSPNVFRVGYGALNTSTVTLASTANVINVAAISVGETTSNGNSSQNNILNLGAGTNALQATNISIGTQKASGVIQFAGSSGTVVISGIGGAGSANISLGNSNSSGTYQPGGLNNGLLLAGHTATVNAGTVIIGNRTSTGAGTVTAQVTFDTGTFNASSITLARATSGHASSTSAVNGTLTLGSTAASTGITTLSGNVLLASHTSNAVGVQTATGVLNISGGTLNVNTAASASGGILDNSTTTTGSSNTTLTLDGGTLNLNGGVIGGNGSSGNRAITNLNFRSGTLRNLSQINGGNSGLNKTTAGTLILEGTNAYTGATLISEGRLVAASSSALGTAGTFNSRTTINTGATLELATDTSISSEFLDITSNNTGAVVVNRATDGQGITQSTGTTYLGSGAAMNVTQGARVTSGTATLGIASVVLASGSVGTGTLNSDTAAISVTGSISSGVNFNKTLALTGSHAGSTISGAISNGSATGENKVSLTKSGVGTWTLSNTNTYTGDTTVKAGTLTLGASGTVANSTKLIVGDAGSSGAILDVSAKTGGFTVGATQTLSGIGTVDANDGVNKYTITMASGATHAAGNSSANGGVGKQTIDGNLNYGAGSVFEWTLNGNTAASGDRGVAGGYDAVDGTGTLAVDAAEDTGSIFRIVLGSGVELGDGFWDTPNTTHTWSDIFSGFSSFTGGFHTSNIEVIGGPENFATYGSFSITSSSLTWTAVPEPTGALAGLLLTFGLLRRRRG